MFRKIVLALRVYRHSLSFVSILLTGSFAFAMYENRGTESLSLFATIFGRILVFLPILYLFYLFKEKELMYYRNLGLPGRDLLIGIGSWDFLLSSVILIVSYVLMR